MFKLVSTETLVAPLALLLAACGSDPVPVPSIEPPCPEDRSVGGTCVGVPAGASCFDATWTEGIACASVTEVAGAGELAAAIASAEPGTCVALGPGKYPSAAVPAGVALLGRGAGCVGIEGVSLAAGPGTALRGVAVGAGGVVVTGAGDARIEATRIEGSAADGLVALEGAAVTIVDSEIVGSASYGVRVWGAGDATLRRSMVEGSRGPGVWLECSDRPTLGCACAVAPHVVLDAVVVRRNTLLGVGLGGVSASLDAVDVVGQLASEDFEPGNGVSIGGCSRVTASGLRVRDSQGPGLLIHDSDATLATGLEVRGNRIGIWVETLGERLVEIEGAQISDNDGIGLFVGSDAHRVKLTDSAIASTRLMDLAVIAEGSASKYESGDGMLWCHGARVEIDGVGFRESARVSLLIEGPVAGGSSIANVTLAGGDEAKGPIQQDLPAGGTQPEVGTGSAALQVTAEQKLVVSCPP